MADWSRLLKNEEFLVTVLFSFPAVIMLPFLPKTIMGLGSYAVSPFDSVNGLFTSTASPGKIAHGSHRFCCEHGLLSSPSVRSHVYG